MGEERDGDGVSGVDKDKEYREYFSPKPCQRPADFPYQADGLTPSWGYSGHCEKVKSFCVTGEDRQGHLKVVSLDGRGIHSYDKQGGQNLVKPFSATERSIVCSLCFIPRYDVIIVSSMDTTLRVYDRRKLLELVVLPTRKMALLFLAYNNKSDQIISGGSEGCHVWRLVRRISSSNSYPSMSGDRCTSSYSLSLIREFKDCPKWMTKIEFDEEAQILLVLKGGCVVIYDTTTNLEVHRIIRAHGVPLTAGLWFTDSQYIVTGCSQGFIKVWACHHKDRGTAPKELRKKGKGVKIAHRKRRRTATMKQPALLKSIRKHSHTVTGLVAHRVNCSLILSSSLDQTLRLWDIHRLIAVAVIQTSGPVACLQSYSSEDGGTQMIYAEEKGYISVLRVCKVCTFVFGTVQEVRRIQYFPQGFEDGMVSGDGSSCNVGKHGLLLVEMDQGLWGMIDESVLVGWNKDQDTADAIPLSYKGGSSQKYGNQENTSVRVNGRKREKGGNCCGMGLADRTKFFLAWAHLKSVADRFCHHTWVPRRSKVVCLADNGSLAVHSVEKGKESKGQSWQVSLPSPNEKVMCMVLLCEVPLAGQHTLNNLLAAWVGRFGVHATCVEGNGGGGIKCPAQGFHGCRQTIGRKCGKEMAAENGVIGLGTSCGGILIVETCMKGAPLAYCEGVFCGPVISMFCVGGSSDVHHNGSGDNSTSHPCRLICMGGNACDILVKGFILPSMQMAFSFDVAETPSCFEVAREHPLLALGYDDGTVQMVVFRGDRVNHLESAGLTGKHQDKIVAISFSDLYRCLATGSANGFLNIWDHSGYLMHTIYLQGPPCAIAFADAVGEIIISQSSGLFSIPCDRWSPRRLLIAVERDKQRDALRLCGQEGEPVARTDVDRGEEGMDEGTVISNPSSSEGTHGHQEVLSSLREKENKSDLVMGLSAPQARCGLLSEEEEKEGVEEKRDSVKKEGKEEDRKDKGNMAKEGGPRAGEVLAVWGENVYKSSGNPGNEGRPLGRQKEVRVHQMIAPLGKDNSILDQISAKALQDSSPPPLKTKIEKSELMLEDSTQTGDRLGRSPLVLNDLCQEHQNELESKMLQETSHYENIGASLPSLMALSPVAEVAVTKEKETTNDTLGSHLGFLKDRGMFSSQNPISHIVLRARTTDDQEVMGISTKLLLARLTPRPTSQEGLFAVNPTCLSPAVKHKQLEGGCSNDALVSQSLDAGQSYLGGNLSPRTCKRSHSRKSCSVLIGAGTTSKVNDSNQVVSCGVDGEASKSYSTPSEEAMCFPPHHALNETDEGHYDIQRGKSLVLASRCDSSEDIHVFPVPPPCPPPPPPMTRQNVTGKGPRFKSNGDHQDQQPLNWQGGFCPIHLRLSSDLDSMTISRLVPSKHAKKTDQFGKGERSEWGQANPHAKLYGSNHSIKKSTRWKIPTPLESGIRQKPGTGTAIPYKMSPVPPSKEEGRVAEPCACPVQKTDATGIVAIPDSHFQDMLSGSGPGGQVMGSGNALLQRTAFFPVRPVSQHQRGIGRAGATGPRPSIKHRSSGMRLCSMESV